MFEAILNVLAILALTIAAGFIILLLVDLVLGCIDGKRGVIFFRNRKNTNKDNEILLNYNKDVNLNDSYYLQNNPQDLTLDFDKQYEKENEVEQTNNIDLEKAEAEQKLIEEKNKESEDVLEEKTEEPETEVNEEFTFINKVSPELEKELEDENKIQEEDDDFDVFADEEDDEEDDEDEQSIEEILNAIRERNMRARNQFLKEEDLDPDFEDEEDEELSEEEKIEEFTEEKTEVLEAIEEVKEVENKDAVQSEIDKLNEIIKELNAKIEAEQTKNAELENKAKIEIENLKKEYEEKLDIESDEVPTESIETLEIKLAELLERQKQNDKDLKLNKKEYLPLARIEKTLESDENKLRRREALVAKRKIVLFGVNNYVQDEEKERKLQEDLDLLEGLRMSVNHCKEVMDANKDRYPVLKRTNEILTRNAEQIENDIKEVEEKLAKARELQSAVADNDSDDTTGENN